MFSKTCKKFITFSCFFCASISLLGTHTRNKNQIEWDQRVKWSQKYRGQALALVNRPVRQQEAWSYGYCEGPDGTGKISPKLYNNERMELNPSSLNDKVLSDLPVNIVNISKDKKIRYKLNTKAKRITVGKNKKIVIAKVFSFKQKASVSYPGMAKDKQMERHIVYLADKDNLVELYVDEFQNPKRTLFRVQQICKKNKAVKTDSFGFQLSSILWNLEDPVVNIDESTLPNESTDPIKALGGIKRVSKLSSKEGKEAMMKNSPSFKKMMETKTYLSSESYRVRQQLKKFLTNR